MKALKLSAIYKKILRRGVLTEMLAAAVAVTGAVAQERRVAGQPARDTGNITSQQPRPVIGEAGDYSKDHPVVAIAILKGTKDEEINSKTGKPFTGEEIGAYFARRLTKEVPPVPENNIKVFVRQTDGDYTRVAFFVKGHLLGKISSGDEAKLGTGAVSHAFEMAWDITPRHQLP